MAKRSGPINPFYIVLIVAGIAFAVTACAYGVMTFLAMQSNYADTKTGLLAFLEEHGGTLLAVELGLLAIATFAAIGTDSYWERRAAARDASNASRTPTQQT
ncbi:MAG: hypothetical protein KF708_17145 [Pirellulales bacterium]|nr:hypothetical protein [Pirellulales bacterium]